MEDPLESTWKLASFLLDVLGKYGDAHAEDGAGEAFAVFEVGVSEEGFQDGVFQHVPEVFAVDGSHDIHAPSAGRFEDFHVPVVADLVYDDGSPASGW